MFGRKKDTIQAVPLSVKVQSMPKEFYGGANPVVTFHDVKKDIAYGQQAPLSKAEKAAFNQTSVAGHHAPLHAANLLTNSKIIILGALGLFVLFALGAGGYYWYQNRQSVASQIPAPPTPSVADAPPAPVVETPPVTEVATSTVPEVPPTNVLLEFPALGLADSTDSDTDGLSDAAEVVFKTNPDLPDSDNDGYSDAHEIFYLYNPAGKEPMKLIEAGTVKEYDNPVFNYSLYYPMNWAVGNTKEDYRDILFSTLGGDNIEVLAVDKENGQDFATWFLQNVPSEQMSNYAPFESRFGVAGFERSDKLVYFIVTPDRVYILAYHVPDASIVSYRIILNMMARSFNLSTTTGNTAPLEMINPEVAPEVVVTTTEAGTVEEIVSTSTIATSTP